MVSCPSVCASLLFAVQPCDGGYNSKHSLASIRYYVWVICNDSDLDTKVPSSLSHTAAPLHPQSKEVPRIAIPTSSTYWTSLSPCSPTASSHTLFVHAQMHTSLSMHIEQGQGHHNFITRWLERHPSTLNTGEHQESTSNPSKSQPGPGRTSSSGTASFPSTYPHHHISLAGVPASSSYGTAPHQPRPFTQP